MKQAHIFFTKEPVLGKVKTRLAQSIGEKEALKIYSLLLEQFFDLELEVDTFTALLPYTDDYAKHFKNHNIFIQNGKNIGQKMANAFLNLFAKGYEQVVLTGGDIPLLDETIIRQAFDDLSYKDAVINPTQDGGYYLIGFNKGSFKKEVFEVDFSRNVYTQTLKALQPLHVKKGKELFDVDTIQDLRTFLQSAKKETKLLLHVRTLLQTFPKLSVIIPVYYEKENLPKTIATLQTNAKKKDYEIIVCDTPANTTISQVDTSSFRYCFSAQASRAIQLNTAARLARGEIFLFLHADTLLPQNWDQLIRLHVETFNQAGAFQLGIKTKNIWIKFISFCTNVRVFVTYVPYGDQAIFVTSKAFSSVKGFEEIEIMEDISFIKKLKKRKIPIKILQEKVYTSERIWRKEGIFYTTFRNRILSSLYLFGVNPKKLKNFYKNNK
jgi:rSAM/selenodomain-associated transferase 2/rSAM/selenodomain-associated transferase 1